MIHSIGIDAIEISRFAHWYKLYPHQLARIFSQHEITYCLSNTNKSAERFAGRFATKEAFFKAWHSAFPHHYIPLLRLCRAISLEHSNHQIPHITIQWQFLPSTGSIIIPLVTLTHTQTLAIACIMLNIQAEK
jgi:phosphopantetheine--protein transferase-like protein